MVKVDRLEHSEQTRAAEEEKAEHAVNPLVMREPQLMLTGPGGAIPPGLLPPAAGNPALYGIAGAPMYYPTNGPSF
ncbi:hypothetical protein X801_09417 [Opisthorchis viverrini]|uniref:Uncharacterized protein n=1 Tax=Opisthorchis viverrini TaxID=6198 RepID=A0A1S8WK33_OPIVI|nr:hypothetical protein X801_09417 [Opisthorchis viverrini]